MKQTFTILFLFIYLSVVAQEDKLYKPTSYPKATAVESETKKDTAVATLDTKLPVSENWKVVAPTKMESSSVWRLVVPNNYTQTSLDNQYRPFTERIGFSEEIRQIKQSLGIY